MRTVGSTALLTPMFAAALLAACADAPSSPAPAGPAPSARSLASLAAAPTAGDVVVSGTSFASIETRAGGWMETFELNSADRATWMKLPAVWSTTDALAISTISQDYAPAITSLNPNPSPQSAVPNSLAGWSIVRHTRDRAFWYNMEAMSAWHDGMNCAAPPATHTVTTYDSVPFFCRNHMMTATNGSGYAVTYLTPDRMIDFSSGEAVIRFDVATQRTSDRDWIDLWITPYADNLVAPLDDTLPDLQGAPDQAFHLRMSADSNHSRFTASVIFDGRATLLPVASTVPYEKAFADSNRMTSATIRDTFELRLSGGRLRFGMPRFNLWWLDTPMPPLMRIWPSGRGVVQIGHHSFDPRINGGLPDTWHWDNIGIAPAVKFSIINADRRYVDGSLSGATFNRPAPSQSNLRFAGYGSRFEVSFNGGKWQSAQKQSEELNVNGRFHSYWTSVPTGTTRVDFRASNDPSNRNANPVIWLARDITLWSLNP